VEGGERGVGSLRVRLAALMLIVIAPCVIAPPGRAQAPNPPPQTLAPQTPAPQTQAPARTPQAAIKAGYLARLPPFVQWPEGAFESPAAAFSICILGGDPFGPALDQAVSGRRVGQHPVEVKRMAKLEKAAGCHLLYLGALSGPAAAEALASVKDAPVLTVTDSQRAEDPRGVIDFRMRGRRVRFAVDEDAARRSGLVVSSKLLDLAVSVKPRRGRARG
jgi:hypothetical protein